MVPQDSSCVFCAIGSARDTYVWYNEKIAEVPGVGFIVPTLGALIPGYVLIVPYEHVPSCREIVPSNKLAFALMVNRVTDIMREELGRLTVFEHGSCGVDEYSGSACIIHAHLHVVPGFFALGEAMTDVSVTFGSLTDFLMSYPDGAPYLMCQDPDAEVLVGKDVRLGQFFRRIVAARLDIAEEWDFAVFHHETNISETYAILGSLRGQFNG